MISKYSGICKKTGCRYYKGDKIKWLGRGKGAELISHAEKPDSDDGKYDGKSHHFEWQNEAGEPLYNPIAGWRADDDYRD